MNWHFQGKDTCARRDLSCCFCQHGILARSFRSGLGWDEQRSVAERNPNPECCETAASFAGISVLWMSEPDSSSIRFGDDPLDEYLDLGTAFEVGTTIEWRTGLAGAEPVAAIVRYRSGESVANLARSQLVRDPTSTRINRLISLLK